MTELPAKGMDSNASVGTRAGESFFSQISDNPFFSAGLGLAGLGVLLRSAQKGVRHGALLMKRRLLVDVEISVKDESYPSFLHWMTAHHRAQLPATLSAGTTSSAQEAHKGTFMGSLMRRFTPRLHHLSIQTEKIKHPNGSVQTRYALMPGPGRHLLRYRNAFLLVNRVRETKSLDLASGRPWETITLTALYSQRQVFEELFTEAHKLAQQSTEGKTIVYTARTASWEPFGEPQRKRPLESVILDKGVKEGIVADVKDFLGRSQWYYSRGIPYRRGYLLHGPPGSGKSSFIQALAGELDYNIANLNLSERGLTDDRLHHLLRLVPQRTLVLLEDADVATVNRGQSEADGYRGANVTLSGLLNAIDGVASAEERLIFLTTNYIERLDSALIRPGRVDMTVRLGEATRYQASMLWDRFYGELDQTGEYKREFLARLETLGIIDSQVDKEAGPRQRTSTAALQGLFLFNKDSIRGAIDMAVGLLPDRPHTTTS